jgi:hypothetical protein
MKKTGKNCAYFLIAMIMAIGSIVGTYQMAQEQAAEHGITQFIRCVGIVAGLLLTIIFAKEIDDDADNE